MRGAFATFIVMIAKVTRRNNCYLQRSNPGGEMLNANKLVGFLTTTDYEKARAFYVGKLGFEFVSLEPQFALAVRAGANMIRITKSETFKVAQGTVLGWEVDDIRAVVSWLGSRGVETEKYPFVEDKETGIWNSPSGAKWLGSRILMGMFFPSASTYKLSVMQGHFGARSPKDVPAQVLILHNGRHHLLHIRGVDQENLLRADVVMRSS
jgi:catechol 2,3-dioxygenase-like lactoylglutathione lyase family enzyme